MFRILFTVLLMCLTVAAAEASTPMSLADARGNIDVVVASPAAMIETMKRLSAEDQRKFLGEVNSAVVKMPGSPEHRAAKLVEINRAAFKGAKKGNLANLVAEMYATASIEALTIINERFGAELFNRAANSAVTFTDEQFEKIALSVMQKVRARTETVDNSDVRNTMAVAMFIRASNGSPKNLAETLTRDMKPEVREKALKEWIPQAVGETAKLESPGDQSTGDYESMLGEADAGERPAVGVVLRLYAPQMLDAMLADMASGVVDVNGVSSFPILDAGFGYGHDLDTRHDIQNPVPEGVPGIGRPVDRVKGESGGYQWQRLN